MTTFACLSGDPCRHGSAWTTSIVNDPLENGPSCHADLLKSGTFVCRVALMRAFRCTSAVEVELKAHVDRWIDEYELRFESARRNGHDLSGPAARSGASDAVRETHLLCSARRPRASPRLLERTR